MSAPFAPPNRARDMSPVSIGSEWSGMKNYKQPGRIESPLAPLHRGDSVTPPDVGYANGYPPYKPDDFNGLSPMESLNQRRPSDDGSRGSSRAPSIANSRSSDGTISDQQSKKYRRMEMELGQHYTVLRSYLRGGAQQPPRPNKARDKLLRLSPVQFHELSTDVFDELQRRQAAAPLPGRAPRRENVPPYLQPRRDFHEKRNQARQKLSSLQTPRFRDLSTDVFMELERRFPHFARPDGNQRDRDRSQSRGPGGRPSNGNNYPPNGSGPSGYPPPLRSHTQGPSISSSSGLRPRTGSVSQLDNSSEYGRPMPRQFQSNTITPNKSTVVEDEDEVQGVEPRYDRSSDAFGLESSLTSPRSNRDTSATSQSMSSAGLGGRSGQAKIAELQEKIQDLELTLDTKEQELHQLKADARAGGDWLFEKQDLEDRLTEAQRQNQVLQDDIDTLRENTTGGDGQWKIEYDHLESKHRDLQEEFKVQREITDEVSRQGQLYLQEMRDMAESGAGNSEREEKLQADVLRLENEMQEWKSRYVKAKTQLRGMRASTLGLSIAGSDFEEKVGSQAFSNGDGLVKDVHVTKFQIAIDELLKVARSGEPTAVLDHVKAVVLAVRSINSEIHTPAKEDEASKRRLKLKGRVSATANNVITAAKNFAAADGLSPVSLLDAAASHLTAAVVDLLRTVKIRPTPAGELEDDDDETLEPLQRNGYFDIAESLRRRSAVESVYSALDTPPEDRNGDSGPDPSPHGRPASNYINGNGMTAGLGIQAELGLRPEESELEELKIYIENQSDQLVGYIQALIEAIRGQEAMSNVRSHIADLAAGVENVALAAEGAANEPSSYQAEWQEQTTIITHRLHECRRMLMQASDDSEAYDGQPSAKEFTQTLPPLAFQVAKETRELVRRIQGIKTAAADDDFR